MNDVTTHPAAGGTLVSEVPGALDLAVTGMTCGGCAKRVAAALEAVPGVTSADVDHGTGRARVAGPADVGGAGGDDSPLELHPASLFTSPNVSKIDLLLRQR